MPTKIEWAEETWNPITGCSPVSAGCAHCYAQRMAGRLAGRFGYSRTEPFGVTRHAEKIWHRPLAWRKPRLIFVCSMGDLFHEEMPHRWIHEAYETMAAANRHTFIVCTKRPERIVSALYGVNSGRYIGGANYYVVRAGLGRRSGGNYCPNIWHLTSVEDQATADERIPELQGLRVSGSIGWPVLGVSAEPLLGPIDLSPYLRGANRLDWVICGAETGPGARPMHRAWAEGMRDQCRRAGVPFFFKRDSAGNRNLDGRLWEERP